VIVGEVTREGVSGENALCANVAELGIESQRQLSFMVAHRRAAPAGATEFSQWREPLGRSRRTAQPRRGDIPRPIEYQAAHRPARLSCITCSMPRMTLRKQKSVARIRLLCRPYGALAWPRRPSSGLRHWLKYAVAPRLRGSLPRSSSKKPQWSRSRIICGSVIWIRHGTTPRDMVSVRRRPPRVTP
jgi:hypothetical protein